VKLHLPGFFQTALARNVKAKSGVNLKGFFSYEVWDPKKGLIKKVPFVPNGNTTAGLNDILGVYFAQGTQKLDWFFGLVDNSGFSSFNASDTISSHSGWSENTQYAEGIRQAWGSLSIAGGSIVNTASAVFTANASIAIAGAFLCSNSTSGGTTGILWATGAFASVQNLTTGQTLPITYTIPAS
jgi:hypothetical protein